MQQGKVPVRTIGSEYRYQQNLRAATVGGCCGSGEVAVDPVGWQAMLLWVTVGVGGTRDRTVEHLTLLEESVRR